MRIIVLQGMPNTGKTITLNLVHDLLLQSGGVSTNRRPLDGDPRDFTDIVIWKTMRVAFYTMGDYSNLLNRAVYSYAGQNCDVLICALSTNTPKVNANKAINRFNNTRINKTLANAQMTEQQANNADTQTIFNLI